MSSKTRGNAFEKKLEKYLKGLGWLVERAHPKLCFIAPGVTRSVSHDLHGCFDFHALHPNVQASLLMQASIDKDRAKEKMRKIDALGLKAPLLNNMIQVWLRDSSARGRILVWDKTPNGSWTETSFRLAEGVWPPHVLGRAPEAEPSLRAPSKASLTQAAGLL